MNDRLIDLVRWLRLDGLRARLTVAVAFVVIATLAVSFVFVYNDAGTRLRTDLDHDIRGSASQLARALTLPPNTSSRELMATARRYVSSQPFGRGSALLFLLVPGVGTASNHPELFGRVRPDHESPAEQALESRMGRLLAVPRVGYNTREAPDVGSLRFYEQRFTTAGRVAYAGAAQPLSTIRQTETGIARSFLLGGGIVLLLALGAAYLIGTGISAPMRRLANVAARVGAGDLAPRMHPSPSSSREVLVLAEAFNHMLDRLSHAFEGQREFIADASHELRTPLTVIRGQLEVLASDDRANRDDLLHAERQMQSEVARITRLVDDLLLLAQSDQREFLHLAEVELSEFVTDLWDSLSLTAERNFEIGRVAPVTVRADPDRLAQALRNLARNAIEHTEAPDGLVRVDVEPGSTGNIVLAVSDDGPGIPEEFRELVFERFYRTDPARTRAAGGAGLGLAIVKAIAEAHGGTVSVTDSIFGGARFDLQLPISSRSAAVSSRAAAARIGST
ncbi:MAG TPA: HAMP domain-containing sensor histidine kinase [Solirubrobacteraceae bacterium]